MKQIPAWMAGAALLVATFAAHAPALRAGFIWDDDYYVTENPTLVDLDGLRQIWLDTSATPQYYPLVHTTFWIERRLFGLHPAGYHAVNILLHAISALVLWRVLLLLAVPGAYFAAALFALHPVHVESVAWVTERKNVLSGLLYLLAALAYLRFAMGNPGDTHAKRQPRGLLLAFVAFLGALLSKTVTATLPAALGLVLWWRKGRVERRHVVYLGTMLAAGAAMGSLTAWLETHQIGTRGAEWSLAPWERLLVAGHAFWFYLSKLLWPHPLTFIYPRWSLEDGLPWTFFYPAAAVVVIVALFALRRRLGLGPFVAIAFFTITLAPALGFFDVYPMRYAFVADHFQYLASIGPLSLLASLGAISLASVRGRPRATKAILSGHALILVLLASLTWRQGLVYRDQETLWRDTLHKNPSSWMAHNNLAILLAGRGSHGEAKEHFEEAIRLKPDHASAHANLGYLLTQEGRLEEAIRHLEEAAVLEPDDFNARVHLAEALRGAGRLEEAEIQLSHALRLRPGDPEAELRMGALLLAGGRAGDAASHYERAARGSRGADAAPALSGLGLALARQGKTEEAIEAYRAAVQLAPKDADLHYNLGTLLARSGHVAEAIVHLAEAVHLRPDFEEAKRNLALAREETAMDPLRGPR